MMTSVRRVISKTLYASGEIIAYSADRVGGVLCDAGKEVAPGKLPKSKPPVGDRVEGPWWERVGLVIKR